MSEHDDVEDINALIERSSLGEPGAKALRFRTSDRVAERWTEGRAAKDSRPVEKADSGVPEAIAKARARLDDPTWAASEVLSAPRPKYKVESGAFPGRVFVLRFANGLVSVDGDGLLTVELDSAKKNRRVSRQLTEAEVEMLPTRRMVRHLRSLHSALRLATEGPLVRAEPYRKAHRSRVNRTRARDDRSGMRKKPSHIGEQRPRPE